MPRGYRLFILALGLILCAAVNPPRGNGQKQTSNTGAQVQQPLADIASALRDANKPSNLDKPCEKGQEDRSSDLCAQWKAADAAWLFGTLGALIGLLTLAAAGAAAYYAKQAADHTETGAKATTDAIKETRRIGEAQVRAYLSINGAEAKIRTGPSRFEFRVTVKNTGQSPAFITYCEYSIMLPSGEEVERIFRERVPVGAGDTLGAPLAQFLSPLTGNKTIVARAALLYEDVFGVSHSLTEVFAGPTTWGDDGVAEGFAFRHDMISAIEVEESLRSAKRKRRTANDDSRNRGQ